MSRTSTALKRLGVAALATVTLGAVVPTLTATGALADHTGFTITQSGSTPAPQGAGDCVLYTVTAVNGSGNAAGTPTVTIRLTESPADDNTVTEVSFCEPSGTEVTTAQTEDAVAVFQTTRNGGASTATFGVSRTTAGDVRIDAFTDYNNNGLPNANEPAATANVTTFGAAAANTNPAQASTVQVTPETSTATTGGQSDTFTATIRDAAGQVVKGATATVTVSTGTINNSGTNTVVLVSDANGVITFRTTSATAGNQTVTVTLQNGAKDTSVVVFSAPATSCNPAAQIALARATIIATGNTDFTVTGPAGAQFEVFAYSQPSTKYNRVRTGTFNAQGTFTFTGAQALRPPTNTRLYAQTVGCAANVPAVSRVLNVRTQLSLNVVRNGKQTYTFSGSAIPARPRGLIVSLYRVTASGQQVLTSQTRANANVGQAGYNSAVAPGTYKIVRKFTGTGRFGFVVRTGQDLQNAPGSSNVRSLLVF